MPPEIPFVLYPPLGHPSFLKHQIKWQEVIVKREKCLNSIILELSSRFSVFQLLHVHNCCNCYLCPDTPEAVVHNNGEIVAFEFFNIEIGFPSSVNSLMID